MIEEIRLHNFQIHEDITVPLGKVSVLVGDSDSGKSSLFRAVQWVTENRPIGKYYTTHGKRGCFAQMTVDGHTIRRTKNCGENSYVVDGTALTAFGTTVPKEVSDLLNLSDISVKHQDDGRFLINDTPSEVGRKLNEVVNLSVIDTTLDRLKASVRDIKSKLKQTEADIEEKVLQQKELAYLPEFRQFIETYAAALTDHEHTHERADALREVITEYKKLNNPAEQLTDTEDLLGLVQEVVALEKRQKKLSEAAVILENCTIPVADMELGLREVEAREISRVSLQAKRDTLAALIAGHKQTREDLAALNKTIAALNESYSKLLDTTCPTCGQKIERTA